MLGKHQNSFFSTQKIFLFELRVIFTSLYQERGAEEFSKKRLGAAWALFVLLATACKVFNAVSISLH